MRKADRAYIQLMETTKHDIKVHGVGMMKLTIKEMLQDLCITHNEQLCLKSDIEEKNLRVKIYEPNLYHMYSHMLIGEKFVKYIELKYVPVW